MARDVLRFTGVGGQGVLLAGEIFASAKINLGGFGVKTATYTSQVRGGPTVVDIQLDDKEIWYPHAVDGEVDFMLSVADASYQLFKGGVRDGATIVIEPNLVFPTDEDRKRWNIVEIPIITIAKEEVKLVLTQSVVALAIANTYQKAIDDETLKATMLAAVPERFHKPNLLAYELGKKYAEAALYEAEKA
jgi:2-oxoglutarate ferredoxin oxidoreductase subunit gamma